MFIERVELTLELLDDLEANVDQSQQQGIDDWRRKLTSAAADRPTLLGWIITHEIPVSESAEALGLKRRRVMGCASVDRAHPQAPLTRNVIMSVSCSAKELSELLAASSADINGDGLALTETIHKAQSGRIETWFRGELFEVVSKYAEKLNWQPTRSIVRMEWPTKMLPLAPIPEPDRNDRLVATNHLSFIISPLKPGDEDQLAELNNEAFAGHPDRASWTRATVFEELENTGSAREDILVARANNPNARMCGYIWTRIYDPATNIGELWALGVSPRFSGQGIGKTLLRAGMHRLVRERHMSHLVLYVDAGNFPARVLYRAHDFTDTNEKLGAYLIPTGSPIPDTEIPDTEIPDTEIPDTATPDNPDEDKAN